MQHRPLQGDSELLEKVRVSLRYRRPRTESRHNRIMTCKDPLKLFTIQQVSVLYGDAIPKRLEPLRRANKCRHGMNAFNRLADDLHSRAPSGAQYNQIHAAPRSS